MDLVQDIEPSQIDAADQSGLPSIALNRQAQIIYTSGTTGRPKGVVATWGALEAQINSMTTSWEWKEEVRLLAPALKPKSFLWLAG